MKINLEINCTQCGAITKIELIQDLVDGYKSISENLHGVNNDNIQANEYFDAEQTCEDVVILKCRVCGNKQELTT